MADITTLSVSNTTARGKRLVVFTTAATGYVFYSAATGLSYKKSTDGGATWGSAVVISAALAQLGFDVWCDQWTPGDTGTLIHCWYFEATNDKVFWRTLDTNGDTLGTERTAFTGASAVAVRGAFVSGTKTRSGYLYAAFDIDNGAEHGIVRSTDGGVNWSANLATTFVEAAGDECLLFPATGTGDNNDCWAIYQDASADALTMKMWDSSAAAEVESSTIQTMVDNTTDLAGQGGFSGSVRHSDGHLIIVSGSEFDTATADMQVWDVSGVTAASQSGITAKTAITTDIDDNYYPGVFIDQITDDIYVAYNGKRDGSETMATATKIYYTKSTDGGTSWSAGDTTYEQATAATGVQVWTPLMGHRFYAFWRDGTGLNANNPNSVVTMSPRVSGSLSFSGAAAKSSARAFTASVSFVGSTIKALSRALAASIAFVGALTTGAGAHLFNQALSGTLSFVGAQSRSTLKVLAGALSFIGSLTKSIARSLSGALSFIGSLTKSTARSLSGAVSFVGAITKRISRTFTAALSFIGALAELLISGGTQFAQGLAGALSFAGSTSQRTGRTLTAALSFVGSMVKRASKALSGAISFIGAIAKSTRKALAGALSCIGNFRYPWRASATLSFVGSTSKNANRLLAATLSFASAFSRLRNKLLTSALSFSGSISKTISHVLSGALSFLGGFIYPWQATAELSFSGTLAKSTIKIFSGAISFLTDLAKALTSGVTILWKQLIGSNLQAESTTGELSGTLTSSQLEVASTQSNP